MIESLPKLQSHTIRIFLCRHGQTEYNKLQLIQGRGIDSALNQLGIHQANCLANRLKNVPLDAIYCSTLSRAIQTAHFVSMHHSVAKRDARWDEMSFGKLEGEPRQSKLAEIQRIQESWFAGNTKAVFPNGESLHQVEDRCFEVLHSIVQDSTFGLVAVVTHGRLLKILLSKLIHGNSAKMENIEQNNCCINVVDYDSSSKTFEAILVNDVMHITKQ